MVNPGKNQAERSLRVSMVEGTFASLMSGMTLEYFIPFLLLLGGTAKHVGMLSALPNLFASLIQLRVTEITERVKSRKKITVLFVMLQALVLVLMAALALARQTRPYIFITLVIIFTSFGAISTPAWGSLMSELVAEDKRGEYFGWRNRIHGFFAIGASFIAGGILQIMKTIDIFAGFAMIYILAFVCRTFSWAFLKKIYEPSLEIKKEHYFSFFDFVLKIKTSNFTKFVIFVALFNFSVNLAGPFFSVLMLRDLGFSYLLYTIIIVTGPLTIYSMFSRWGRHADKVGNIRVIKCTAPLIAVVPLLWIIVQRPVFLFIFQIFSGFMWAGFNLCAGNFILDAVTPQKRIRCIAYFNVVNGLALCGGALLGGVLLDRLPPFLGNKIFTLLLISSILRFLVSIFLSLKLKDVRPVENIKSYKLFFSVIGLKPILGIERKTIRY